MSQEDRYVAAHHPDHPIRRSAVRSFVVRAGAPPIRIAPTFPSAPVSFPRSSTSESAVAFVTVMDLSDSEEG